MVMILVVVMSRFKRVADPDQKDDQGPSPNVIVVNPAHHDGFLLFPVLCECFCSYCIGILVSMQVRYLP